MDKSKQPGISFDGIILVENKFWRHHNVPNDAKIDIKFEAANNISENNATVEVYTILNMKSEEKDVMKLDCKFVGFFSVIEYSKNMDIKDYIINNATALMFPYIREHISSITGKAGMNPILLPPLNLRAILNKDD